MRPSRNTSTDTSDDLAQQLSTLRECAQARNARTASSSVCLPVHVGCTDDIAHSAQHTGEQREGNQIPFLRRVCKRSHPSRKDQRIHEGFSSSSIVHANLCCLIPPILSGALLGIPSIPPTLPSLGSSSSCLERTHYHRRPVVHDRLRHWFVPLLPFSVVA
jgi:hypothetical protein